MTITYDELCRPQFHFTPRENWTNDPNGLVYYKGRYHLFFQHNPYSTQWGNMTWGHATSPDLLHWTQHENALLPDRLGTMFSGSAVVDWHNTAGLHRGDEKTLVALYTAAGGTSEESKDQPFTQCLAYSNDAGDRWTKYAHNPVLGHLAGSNRDPKVVWHAPSTRWIMALYLDGSTYGLFTSPNLIEWTHLHDLDMPGCSECPDFFELPIEGEAGQKRWVFTAANGQYLIGTFDGARFTPEAGLLQVDFGANYYAVQTYSDTPDGRRIQLAWMAGGQYPGMPFNQQMSFPCELKQRRLGAGLRLCRTPIDEIETLHQVTHTWRQVALHPRSAPVADFTGELFDIEAEVRLDTEGEGEFGAMIRGTPLVYSAAQKQLECLGKRAPLDAPDGRLQLRILVDRTSIEVFANDGEATLTSCFLPSPDDKGVGFYGNAATLETLHVHELHSIWR